MELDLVTLKKRAKIIEEEMIRVKERKAVAEAEAERAKAGLLALGIEPDTAAEYLEILYGEVKILADRLEHELGITS